MKCTAKKICFFFFRLCYGSIIYQPFIFFNFITIFFSPAQLHRMHSQAIYSFASKQSRQKYWFACEKKQYKWLLSFFECIRGLYLLFRTLVIIHHEIRIYANDAAKMPCKFKTILILKHQQRNCLQFSLLPIKYVTHSCRLMSAIHAVLHKNEILFYFRLFIQQFFISLFPILFCVCPVWLIHTVVCVLESSQSN